MIYSCHCSECKSYGSDWWSVLVIGFWDVHPKMTFRLITRLVTFKFDDSLVKHWWVRTGVSIGPLGPVFPRNEFSGALAKLPYYKRWLGSFGSDFINKHNWWLQCMHEEPVKRIFENLLLYFSCTCILIQVQSADWNDLASITAPTVYCVSLISRRLGLFELTWADMPDCIQPPISY